MSADGDSISFPEANITAVTAIAGVLATTYGPTPHDKFVGKDLSSKNNSTPGEVSYDDYVVTSDGAAILEELPLEHPIAPVVRRIVGPEVPGESDIEGKQIADGTTGTFILTASLLDEAESLLEMGLHPTNIRRGYRSALSVARDTLSTARRPLSAFEDPRATELAVARTTMTGNDVGGRGEMWSEFAVEAARTVGYPTPKQFGIEQVKAGSVGDSRLLRGTVLPRNEIAREDMPTRVTDATVLVLDGYKREDAGDGRVGGLRDPELQTEATIQANPHTDPSEYEAIHSDRRERIIKSLVDNHVDVVVTRLGINDAFMQSLVDHRIIGIRGVNRIKLHRIARATGATVTKNPDDIDASVLGTAGLVQEETVEKHRSRRKRRRIVVFDDCPDPESVTVLLQGTWSALADETTRELRKATAAVAAARGDWRGEQGVVPGGAAIDMGIAKSVRDASPANRSRSQLAMEAFADAAESIAWALSKMGGLDPIETIADIRASDDSRYNTGILLPRGTIGSATDAGVLDLYAIRDDSYVKAVEIANLILGIDEAIDAEFKQTPADEGESIYDDRAEKHADHLEETDNSGSAWDSV